MHTKLVQPLDDIGHSREVVESFGFQQLDLQKGLGQGWVPLEQSRDFLLKPAVDQCGHCDVDAQGQGAALGDERVPGFECSVQHPIVQFAGSRGAHNVIHKRTRRQQPPLGMVPPDQGFGTNHLPIRDSDLGLKKQLHLALQQGVLDQLGRVPARLQPLALLDVEHRDPVLALFLGRIQRQVCMAQQAVSVPQIIGVERDPGAAGQAQLHIVQNGRPRERLAQALQPLQGGFGVCAVFQCHGEFIAANAANEVVWPRLGPEALRKHPKELVGQGLPPLLVEVLELVDVQ
ncbi:hypothetical protein D3C71_1091790 [compost metagenome]